jgi:hypothetical protein
MKFNKIKHYFPDESLLNKDITDRVWMIARHPSAFRLSVISFELATSVKYQLLNIKFKQ